MTSPKRLIGIFDSGLGGLTIVRELLKRSPRTSFVYLGDTARVPYGNRSPATICQYAKEDVRFLLTLGVTDIVVACHTVSAHALSELCMSFPQVPFYDVIHPVVKEATMDGMQRIGVIGTRATIASGIYQREIQRVHPTQEVLSVACPLFVPLVEEGWIHQPETKKIVRRYLAPLKQKQIDTLILGCTHYPLLERVIKATLQKRVTLIHTPSALWNDVAERSPELFSMSDDNQFRQEYYFTDISDRTREMARAWLEQPILLKKAHVSNDA